MSDKPTVRSWAQRVRDSMPVPMAAPESQMLRRMRRRIMGALYGLAAICLFWGWIFAALGTVLVAFVVGLIVFLAVQIPMWAIAKMRADDAWLFRDKGDA